MAVADALWAVKSAVRRGLIALNFDFYKHTDDRRVLETIILPYFAARSEYAHVLFVGCAWYTRGYRHIFGDADYVTMDIDPDAGRYGAKRHIVDSFANLPSHFAGNELDLIVCNGVFGWGLDRRDEVDAAFRASHHCLRDGGVLVIGWNDIPERRPFPLEESAGLRSFERFDFPPLGTSRFLTTTANRHTYDFYRK